MQYQNASMKLLSTFLGLSSLPVDGVFVISGEIEICFLPLYIIKVPSLFYMPSSLTRSVNLNM